MYKQEKIDDLLKEYDKRYLEVCDIESLNLGNIGSSLSLFEKDSIKNRKPIPKKLEVYCVVGGLPFDEIFIKNILELQKKISLVLNGKLHYFVKPHNLAVEVIVIKWPKDELSKSVLESSKDEIKKANPKKFILKSFGFQFHNDGAIILRCLDYPNYLRDLRKTLKNSVMGLPNQQSNWCHVPLGRILEPLERNELKNLIDLANFSQNSNNFSTQINQLHLIHEKRWYQIEKENLLTFDLLD